MRIGLNLLYLLPGIVGGTESYAIGLLEALARVSDSSQYRLFINRETSLCGRFRESEWHLVTCPVPASVRAIRYAWEQFVLPLQTRKYRLELLHSLGYVQPTRLPCKSVVTIHDLNFYNLGHLMSPTKRAALRYFVTLSARSADHIITVSEFSKRQIVKIMGIPPQKVTVTYNAVGHRVHQALPFETVSQQYGLRGPYILALSSFSPHKNLASLIKAFAILREKCFRELRLVVAGHPPRDKRSLELFVRDHRLLDAVVFTGYVQDDVLPTLYAHAEAFVFPSLYEGFGIPVLEAFLYGAPVACSNAAALPEIAGDAACYFDPTNVEEMADVISRLLHDETLRKSLVKRGKERVAQFTWEETARKTLEVYRQVLGSR